MKFCSIPGCDRVHHANGFCRLHNQRWKRKGDPYDQGRGRNVSSDWRFERKRDPSDPTSCWEWQGGRTRDGYGIFWDGTKTPSGTNRNVGAHRWAYERYVGTIPDGLEVCHSCDNPPCVNPAHLYVDTHAANASRAWKLGRNTPLYGLDNPKSKMTPDSVRLARSLHSRGGVTIVALARQFNISSTAMSHLLSGKNWGHVAMPPYDDD